MNVYSKIVMPEKFINNENSLFTVTEENVNNWVMYHIKYVSKSVTVEIFPSAIWKNCDMYSIKVAINGESEMHHEAHYLEKAISVAEEISLQYISLDIQKLLKEYLK